MWLVRPCGLVCGHLGFTVIVICNWGMLLPKRAGEMDQSKISCDPSRFQTHMARF